MRKCRLLLGILLLTPGCSLFHKNTPPSRANSNQIAVAAENTQVSLNDKAAGNNAAIERAANQLPPSRPKDVILMFTGDQYRLLGQPKPETRTEFEKTADLLLSQDAGQRAKGEEARTKAQGENEQLKVQLESQKKDFEKARLQEEADHKAELDKVREAADAANKRLISFIFFGTAAALLALGVVVIMTASYIPMFGPKLGFALLAAGALSGTMGAVVLSLMKELDKHPWILWLGGGIIMLLVGAASLLAYSNHYHHVDSSNNGNQPRV